MGHAPNTWRILRRVLRLLSIQQFVVIPTLQAIHWLSCSSRGQSMPKLSKDINYMNSRCKPQAIKSSGALHGSNSFIQQNTFFCSMSQRSDIRCFRHHAFRCGQWKDGHAGIPGILDGLDSWFWAPPWPPIWWSGKGGHLDVESTVASCEIVCFLVFFFDIGSLNCMPSQIFWGHPAV